MPKTILTAVLVSAVAGLVCVGALAAKPATLRIVADDVVASIEFERGVKVTLTSKPTPVRPDTYWTKSIRLSRKDDKGRTWELRSTDVFGSLANVTVDAEQEKVLLLGKPVGVIVEGKPAEDPPGVHVVSVSVKVVGISGEEFLPGAFLDGKMTLPNAAIKDEAGRVLASGRCEMREGRYGWFTWKHPPGWEGKFDVEVQVFMGPFEYRPGKTITPMKQ